MLYRFCDTVGYMNLSLGARRQNPAVWMSLVAQE